MRRNQITLPGGASSWAELVQRAISTNPKDGLALEAVAALACASDPALRAAARPWILRHAFSDAPGYLRYLLSLPPGVAIGPPVPDGGKALTALVGLRNSERKQVREAAKTETKP